MKKMEPYIIIKRKEKWKVIKKCPNYAVSNWGRIKRITKGSHTWPGRILKQNFNSDGYLLVGLYSKKKQKMFLVHRLVAETFIGLCPEGKEANHMDGNKENPDVQNLEYVTRKENMRHAYKMGLNNNKGENHHNHKLTNKDVIRILKLRSKGLTGKKIANKFDVTPSIVEKILRGEIWKTINRKYLKKNENCSLKLSEKDVVKIRKIYKNGKISQYKLAKRYGVGQPTINKIVTNKAWKHI